MKQKPRPSINQIEDFLALIHIDPITELEPISGGFWSSAYTYEAGGDQLVLRLSGMDEGFLMDATAAQFKSQSLPIPEVIKTGEGLGYFYAISRRHYGDFLEDVPSEKAEEVGGALEKLLMGLRAAPTPAGIGALWYEPDLTNKLSWHNWLRSGLIDNPDSISGGWRQTLAANKPIDDIFNACQARIEELLPYCPERRDLVHGDLLHQNVLISEDATQVNAIFSWKCSVLGDFFFDVAWCTCWGPWHPGIAATDIWNRTLNAPDLSESDLIDASLRHHCYELQIAASHFGWNIWTENEEDLNAVAAAAKQMLNRGPLPI